MTRKRTPADRRSFNLDSIVTVEMIIILLGCYYAVHWLIYPEALDYLALSQRHDAGVFSRGLARYSDFTRLGSLGTQVRFSYAVIESLIGILQALLLTAVLSVGMRYLLKKTGQGYFQTIAIMPWIAFTLSVFQLLAFASLILTYPLLSAVQSIIALTLAIIALSTYVVAGLLLASGIVRNYALIKTQT